MSSNATTRQKGKGWFENEYGVIYVQGSVDGKFRRKSTGMEATPKNIAYIKKNYRDVLLQLLSEGKATVDTNFVTFGLSVIEAGAKTVDKNGKKSRRGRDELAQKDAISKFNRYIVPFFKGYALEEIKPMHVEAWLKSLLYGKSTSTVSKCKNLLNEIMHKACGNDIIPKNPVDYVDKVEVEHEKQEAYSLEDARKMMTKSTGWMHTYLNLAFTTGMRTGEMLALKWEDIDWEYSCIYLQRSVTKGRMAEGNAGNKNHTRIVHVLPAVLKILKISHDESSSEWIFPSKSGSFFKESKSVVKYHFKPLLDELGVEYISLYATRHTFATIADNLRVNTKTVDDMVGNSEKVRKEHYVTFEMTREREAEAQAHLVPVNNVFFPENGRKAK